MKIIVYPDASEGIEEKLAGHRRQRLEKLGELKIFYDAPADHQEFQRRINGAHALLVGWALPVEVMTQTPTLEILSFTGIGASNFIDLPAAASQGITVCNCPGYADDTIAEHTLALLLAVARHVPQLDTDLRNGRWNQSLDGMELGGKQLGIIGFGGIGRRVSELARAFRMTVKVWTRNPSEARAHEHGVEFVSLNDLLQTSDVISLHVALTYETKNLINVTNIQQMKPGSILINTARGEIVDETALVDALKERHLKAAGLDVYHQDPLLADHPLLVLDNVVLSPHVAYNTPEAGDAIYEIAVENIVKYYEGKPINIVAAPGQE